MTIIDISSDCGSKASALAAAGVRTVIRYYSRDTIRPSKPLGAVEAGKLAAAGLRIGIVYEGRFGDAVNNFERNTGVADARFARKYGAETIGQPGGSTIYFAVDFDASAAQIRDRILPYFAGVADAFAEPSAAPTYVVGIYGSGATCAAVLDAGLAQRAWLAQSTGWRGHQSFLQSGRWTLNQAMPSTVAGVDCDPNTAGQGQDIGDFALPPASSGTNLSVGSVSLGSTAMRVNARSGLRLRGGPGTNFDSHRLLPFGIEVRVLKTVGDWTQVDIEGDGAADGFVSGAYLASIDKPTAAGSAGGVGAGGTLTADAVHVQELIRQGSTESGLAAARTTAKNALAGYPTNGCAAHLSALLQHAGIDVSMTLGAGKLASRLADRGWTRISVGEQRSGDVGVCFDNDPTPAGADHIYLVVTAIGPDEMEIADNQNGKVNAPHKRFASGKGGKTPTEYFLRAV